MCTGLRRLSAALLLCGVGLVWATALGMARPAAAETPPCHAAPPSSSPSSPQAPAPCGSVLPLLCCGDHTLPGAVAVPPVAGTTDLAFLPAASLSAALPIRDALAWRERSAVRAAPPPLQRRVLRL